MERMQQAKSGTEVIFLKFNFYGDSFHDMCPLGLKSAFRHL